MCVYVYKHIAIYKYILSESRLSPAAAAPTTTTATAVSRQSYSCKKERDAAVDCPKNSSSAKRDATKQNKRCLLDIRASRAGATHLVTRPRCLSLTTPSKLDCVSYNSCMSLAKEFRVVLRLT